LTWRRSLLMLISYWWHGVEWVGLEEFWFPCRIRMLISYCTQIQISKLTSNMSRGTVLRRVLLVLEEINWVRRTKQGNPWSLSSKWAETSYVYVFHVTHPSVCNFLQTDVSPRIKKAHRLCQTSWASG
jgi:hypothetical protein